MLTSKKSSWWMWMMDLFRQQWNHCSFWWTWTSPPRVFGSDTEGSPIILVHLSTQEQDQTLEPRPLIVPRREVAKRAALDTSQRCPRKWQRADRSPLAAALCCVCSKMWRLCNGSGLFPRCLLLWNVSSNHTVVTADVCLSQYCVWMPAIWWEFQGGASSAGEV